jgi:hypothetical protein
MRAGDEGDGGVEELCCGGGVGGAVRAVRLIQQCFGKVHLGKVASREFAGLDCAAGGTQQAGIRCKCARREAQGVLSLQTTYTYITVDTNRLAATTCQCHGIERIPLLRVHSLHCDQRPERSQWRR